MESLRAWWRGTEESKASPSLRRPDGGLRRVGIFLDTSAESEFAFRWAAANILVKAKDHVYLVSVATPRPFSDAPVVSTDADSPLETPQEALERAAKELQSAKVTARTALALLAEEGKREGIHTETVVLEGSTASLAGPLLVEYAAKRDLDLAVLGSHGRSWSSLMLSLLGLGRVSDYTVRNVSCPICVVKHKAADVVQASNRARAARINAESVAAAAVQEEEKTVERRRRGL